MAFMLLLFYLSHQPSLPVTHVFHMQDKFIHAAAYMVLGILVLGSLHLPPGGVGWPQALITLAIVTLYGISDEIHQSFIPGRDPEVWDAVADSVGGLLAIALVTMLRRLTFFRQL